MSRGCRSGQSIGCVSSRSFCQENPLWIYPRIAGQKKPRWIAPRNSCQRSNFGCLRGVYVKRSQFGFLRGVSVKRSHFGFLTHFSIIRREPPSGEEPRKSPKSKNRPKSWKIKPQNDLPVGTIGACWETLISDFSIFRPLTSNDWAGRNSEYGQHLTGADFN